jgi:acyl-CoA reductase-like NAD-dependent aldehyde dehydrogenase
MSFEERTRIFYKVSDVIAEKTWDISRLDAACNGVPVMHLAMSVESMAPHFKYVCERAKELAEPKKLY